jgi:type IV secretion system protein VirB1
MLDLANYVQNCAPPQYADLMEKIIKVESAGNPFSIGVVRARLARQPVNLTEAVATVRALNAGKYNFSIGLTQVNQVHFHRLGWVKKPAEGFDTCKNISAGAEILNSCFIKANRYDLQRDKREGYFSVRKMALSCYYSGDLFLGERLGYVKKVLDQSSINSIIYLLKPTTMDYSHENR